MTESVNLLDDSNSQDQQLYHEMEMEDQLSVETKDSFGCITISGRTRYTIAAIVASLGGVLFGYDLGIVSGAMLQLKEEFELDCQQQEMVVSSMLFGALIGSLTGGYIIDYVGRRRTIIINAFVFFAGALMLAFASSYALLIVGRLIVGFGTSLSAIAECIYIAEISPPKRRGLLVSVNEIGIASGLLLAYLVNFIFINTDKGWRYMFGISGIPALIQGCGVFFLPPSPRWLVCQGQDAKALRVMQLLNHGSAPEEEISKMKDTLNLERNYNVCYLFGRHENMRDRMLVGLGVVFFQQFTGQPSVLYYAPSIFENIGFRSHSAATLATVGIGFTKFFATILTLSLVDKAGRRRFLLIGSVIMTISIFLLYTVTLCFPGSYHREICENNPKHFTLDKNVTLVPSYSPNSITCTYMVNNHSKSHLLEKSVKLPGKPIFTNLPIHNTQSNILLITRSWNFSLSKATHYPTPTRVFLTNSRSLSPSTNLENRKLVCSPLPTSSIIKADFTTKNQSDSSEDVIPSVVKYVTVFSLMAFAGGYSAGYGPVGWLVLSEIFPTPIKGRAFAATTVLNWGSNLVVSLTMLDLIGSIGVSWTFFIYAILGMLAVIFIYHFVPETKNRSLEEINALFSTRNSALQDCSCLPSRHTFCCNHYNSLSSSTEQDCTPLHEPEWEVES